MCRTFAFRLGDRMHDAIYGMSYIFEDNIEQQQYVYGSWHVSELILLIVDLRITCRTIFEWA